MTGPSDFPNRTPVPARPCAGPSLAGSPPRHNRPAGVYPDMIGLYAVDYGLRDGNGRALPMDLGPLLDAVAALYDGCTACAAHHTAAIVADPILLTHLVGAALCTFSSLVNPVSAGAVVTRLDPAGAAIALTMRSHGLLAAVDVARAMLDADRADVVGIALGQFATQQWFNQPLSNFYPPDGPYRQPDVDDSDVLDQLRSGGYLPA